ncbi:MAG TPA: hypothetical protein VJ742_12480 [Nitrososphaera sp.]|nr:hypothetical protein [Nitrososphaera sp.]
MSTMFIVPPAPPSTQKVTVKPLTSDQKVQVAINTICRILGSMRNIHFTTMSAEMERLDAKFTVTHTHKSPVTGTHGDSNGDYSSIVITNVQFKDGDFSMRNASAKSNPKGKKQK